MKNLTKILSIICLVGVLACGFVPCITLGGGYMELLNGITGAAAGIPEESYEVMEQMLETQGVTIDLKASMDSLTNLATPLADGEITIFDFYTLSENAKEVSQQLSGLPLEGFSILGEETDPAVQAMSSINEMVITLAQVGQTMGLVSAIFLIPVGLFVFMAFFVVLRIIFRILGRRGLGIGITFLTILNAALMIGIPYGVNYAASEGLPISAEYTMVPFIMVACAIVNCIIWAIGRGAKKKVVKEVPVETPVAPVTPSKPAEPATLATPVEEIPVEEVPVEVAVAVEDVVVEAATEETAEEVEDEVLVDIEVVEEAIEEASEDETV